MDRWHVIRSKLRASMPESVPQWYWKEVAQSVAPGWMVQVYGVKRHRACIDFLKEHPTLRVVWLEQDQFAFPPGFAQSIALERLFFIHARRDWPHIVTYVLRSKVCHVLVCSETWQGVPFKWDPLTIRRFQVLAKRSQILVIWLTEQVTSSWCMRFQVSVPLETGVFES
jgi:hypothetical protein